MEKGQKIEVKIEDMSAEGQGIGKYDGFAVFVKDAVVGDVVCAELTKVKKNYGLARMTELITPSQERIEPLCQYSHVCGGCAYGRLSYEGQLRVKEKQVRDKLERLGGIEAPLVRPIIAMEEPFRYRNKASMAVSTGGLMTKKGGIVTPVHEPRVGFLPAKSHDVIDCEGCYLQSEPAMAAARALRQFMEEDHITSYDPRWEKGLMRHMIVRTAAGTGEVMVVLVINGKGIPNGEKLVDMLDEAIFKVPVYEEGPLAGVEFSLESVVVNVNKKKSSEILGEECITIAGKPTIMEEIGGLKFEISPLSFYQVNRQQMERLYGKVLEYAALEGGETVLDLYCGVGSIGLFCAAEMNRKAAEAGCQGHQGQGRQGQGCQGQECQGQGRVIGIESVKSAVVDANRNAVINGIVNARYVCGKAEEVLPQLIKSPGSMADGNQAQEVGEKRAAYDETLIIDRADVVILDPPRAGCDAGLLEAVVKTEPAKIVYVSCDPATLARDVKYLTQAGYRFEEATPVDMFPWTGHVETVVLLTRKAQ
ncbi:MAG: 23S rRNA (uracil(1939)-C(5))-methyltransferase RlmD [Firmicutes bacterium]|nr:23S rRNA (uracil(1939)-C(5))-methyltransferase RlmD [Bacillota bacterium]